MKFYRNFSKICLSLLMVIFCVMPSAQIKVWAQENICSEAKLRNLGVAVLNCSGDIQCAPGVATPISMVASNNIPEPHKSVLERAASQFSVNPNFLAALFLTEQGNIWKPFEGPYASSPVGASGPFQFMPGTWNQYKEDGNGDGVANVQNFEDAAYAAAKLVATGTDQSTPLGDLAQPFAPNTLIYFSAAYNWGGGNLQSRTNPNSPLSAAPTETQNYMKNVHTLLSSDFTQSGHSAYGPPRLPGEAVPAPTVASTVAGNNCVSNGSATSLVTTDPVRARSIILSSSNIVWGNSGSAPTQKEDISNCLEDPALLAIATIAERVTVKIPVNALATDHGGCDKTQRGLHNRGLAIDIGYHGNNSQGSAWHVADGDTLYKFLQDNRNTLSIDELIWQYPPNGYRCMDNGKVGECDRLYSPAIMNQHYHHIHVSFK